MARFNIITQRIKSTRGGYAYEGKSILCNLPIEETLEKIKKDIDHESYDIDHLLMSKNTLGIEEYILDDFFGIDVFKYEWGEDYAQDESTVMLSYEAKSPRSARAFIYYGEVEGKVGYIDITAAIDSEKAEDIAIGVMEI